MRRKFFQLLTLLIIVPAFAEAQNRSMEFEDGEFKDALAKAKKTGRLVYIDCYTTWCGPCKWMAKNVFTNDTVADFYNKNFVNVKIDMEKGEGIELAKKYGIQAYPTNLYVNDEGVQVYRMCGALPTKMFVSAGQTAMIPTEQFQASVDKFGNGKTSAQNAIAYFDVLERGCQAFEEPVEKYFSNVSEKDLVSRANWAIIYKYVTDYNSGSYEKFRNSKNEFEKLAGEDSVNDKLDEVLGNGLWSALRSKNTAEFDKLRELLKNRDTKRSKEIILSAEMSAAAQKGDWNQYAILASEYAGKYASDNAGELNSISWTFYENVTDKALLTKAADWAKKATELQPDYAFFDTYAAVLYKLGKKPEAKQNAEKAIAMAKESGADYKETEELLNKINALP